MDTESGALYLTPHVFVARASGALVFLDLHKDRYSCVETRFAFILAERLGLPPDTHRPGADNADMAGTGKVVADLVAQGLVVEDRAAGKPAQLLTMQPGLCELPGRLPGDRAAATFKDAYRFLNASIAAAALLKVARFEQVTAHVRRRRLRYRSQGGAPACAAYAADLVDLFNALRPLTASVKDRCVYNALLLLEFLASYGVFPEWRFGVRMNAFHAHCWVEDGGYLYNDALQTVCGNSLIMAV